MAEFKSRYVELGFYVDGEFKKFSHGRYVTDDKKEIEVLSGLIDAERVDDLKPEKKAEKPAKPSAK